MSDSESELLIHEEEELEIPVETVEKKQKKGIVVSSDELFDWISSTLKFWHKDEEWPMNLITKICENVSRSHINDK